MWIEPSERHESLAVVQGELLLGYNDGDRLSVHEGYIETSGSKWLDAL